MLCVGPEDILLTVKCVNTIPVHVKANSSPACLHYSPAEWHGLPVCPGPEPASHPHVLQQQAASHGVRSASSSSSGRKLLRLLVLSAFQPRVPCLPLQRSLVVHRVSFVTIWYFQDTRMTSICWWSSEKPPSSSSSSSPSWQSYTW